MLIDIDVDDLVDEVAQLLDEQDGPGGAYRWDENPPAGWASQQAFRDAYRQRAREILTHAAPWITDRVVLALQDQLLPQLSEIRTRLREAS